MPGACLRRAAARLGNAADGPKGGNLTNNNYNFLMIIIIIIIIIIMIIGIVIEI